MSKSFVNVKRPILRYHGGKWMLAPWIIDHFPPHRIYVEPFGGAASVLLRKERSYAEVYNDLDGEICNLFRVVRGHGDELRRRLQLTPYSRSEFEEAWFPSDDPIEQARRTIIRSHMGFASAAVTLGRSHNNTVRGGLRTGFRANSNRSGTTPAQDWRNLPGNIDSVTERLSGVVLENRQAIKVINQHDSEDTLFYCDPPYVQSTRDGGGDYAHEMTDDDHRELARVLTEVRGMVVVSGYPSKLYCELFDGWLTVSRLALADGARERTEVIWMNRAAESARVDLFS